MNALVKLNTFKNPSVFRTYLKCRQSALYKSTSAEPALKEKQEDTVVEPFENIVGFGTPRTAKAKKPKREPFLKSLPLGIYDTEILTYPEIEKEELDALNSSVEPVKQFFEHVGPENTYRKLSDNVVENMKNLRLFGIQVPQVLGGRELTVTEECRFNEFIAGCTSIAPSIFNNEYMGIQLLLKYGTEEQKAKYLPDIISGKVLCATCVNEASNNFSDQTFAAQNKDNGTWVINGEKTAIINGSKANLYFVYARTVNGRNPSDLLNHKYTIFILEHLTSDATESSANGISTYACNPLGVDGTDIANVKFENSVVPEGNIIGISNLGEKTISSLLLKYRLTTGTASCSILRILRTKFVEHVKTVGSDISLANTDLVKCILAKNAMSLYALESMIYLTAGLLDNYENQDCEVEASAVKAFACDQYNICFPQTLGFLGHRGYMSDNWCNKLYRDGLSYFLLDENISTLKIEIAIRCLMHIGSAIKNDIKQTRNPAMFPLHYFKDFIQAVRQEKDNPKLTLQLKDYLHPSLMHIASNYLEYSVLRLEFATKDLLAKHGREVVNKHMDLIRLADVIIDIYAMTASIGRASRSYCIGLQDASNEYMMAGAFSLHAAQRVKENVKNILNSPFENTDTTFKTTAQRIFEIGDLFPEHPLSRSY